MQISFPSFISQCCGLRKTQPNPRTSDNPAPDPPAETEPLLNNSNPQQDHYQKWLVKQYQSWKQSGTSRDFDAWLEYKHRDKKRTPSTREQRQRNVHAARMAAASRGVII